MKNFSRYEIAEVIAEEFGFLLPTDNFADVCDADEIDMMNLCAKLETKFDVKIPPYTEMHWITVRDVYDFFEARAREFPKAVTA